MAPVSIHPATFALLVAALVAGATTGAVALPTQEESGDGLRISAPGYEVDLSPSGALTRVARPGLAPVYQAPPGAAAWVLRATEAWTSSEHLPPTCTVQADGEELVIEYRYAGTHSDSTLEVVAEYRFFDAAEFTLTGIIKNAAGPAVDLVAFPAPLVVDGAPLVEIIFPYQRGIAVLPPEAGTVLGATIPSGFTDFVSFETENGNFAVSEPVALTPPTDHAKRLALYRAPKHGIESLGYHIDRTMELHPGETWTSGTTLFQVGRPTAEAARRHWKAGATKDYPTLRAKLPTETFERLSRSVLFKFPDGRGLNGGLESVRRLIEGLPSPSLLHLCGYMRGGHDSNFPDYLPPDPRLGTLEELRTLVAASRARGVLVMPYTNPTWWDVDSPTMIRLGMEAALLDEVRKPRFDTYGDKRGVVVDPTHPGVRARLSETVDEFAAQLPVDFLFEDQVGARDAKVGPPGPQRWGQAAAMVENTRTLARRIPLMTEGGWDRLAETEIGFCGNGGLDWEKPRLLPDRWRAYPLMQIMANEHTATYPHNLAGERMVHNRQDLLFNVAFGSNMAYDLNRGEGEWMRASAELQARVLHRAFGQEIVAFEDRRPTDGWTRLEYANGDEVFANWSASPVEWRSNVVAAAGFAYSTKDSSIVAGYFEEFNGRPLGGEDLVISENGVVDVLIDAMPSAANRGKAPGSPL